MANSGMVVRKSKYICSAALGSLVLFAAPAMAQSSSQDRLALDLLVDARYDSNVYNISSDRDELDNIEMGDWLVSPALRLSLQKTLGQHSLNASAYAGYDFHASNSDLNRERLSLQLGGRFNLAPCEVSPHVGFSRHRSEYGSYFVTTDPLVDVKNIQTEQTYGLNASCGGVLGLRPEAGVSYTKGDNSAFARQFSDFETVEGRLGLGYRHPSLGNISAYYSKAKTTFDNRIINGEKEGYDVDRIGLSAQRDIGARLAWDGSLYYVTTSTGNDGGFDGLGYQLGVTMRVTPQLRARAQLGRDVQTSLNNDALYTVDNTYGITFDYAASNWLSFNAGYNRTDRDLTYSTFFGPLPIEILQEEKLDRFDLGATYQRSDRLAFTLYGGYEKRTADREFFNYDGYFVGLRATIGLLR